MLIFNFLIVGGLRVMCGGELEVNNGSELLNKQCYCHTAILGDMVSWLLPIA